MFVRNKSALYVKGNVDISGLVILAPGASLTLYVKGPNCTLLGTYDKSDIPAEFLLYGLPSLKALDVSGFAAAVYAPNANLTLNGKADFYGAAVVNSATFNGHSSFHYDECLSSLTGFSYTVSSWNEL